MSVLVKGGTIVTSTGRYVADVYAEGDKIKSIGKDLDQPADEVVDASGKYVLPGAIDPHTHISMPSWAPAPRTTIKPGPLPLPAAV